MSTLLKGFFYAIIGLAFPILCFLIFWWSSLLFTHETGMIILIALTGFCVGIAIDITLSLFWNVKLFQIAEPIMVLVYLFYSICVFGFFMGVPIFQPVLGVFAGYYQAHRIKFQNAPTDIYKSIITKTSRFTAIIMGIICILSAAIALADKYTAANIKGMLNLSFEISKPTLVAFIISGGLFLTLLQYVLTQRVMKATLQIHKP